MNKSTLTDSVEGIKSKVSSTLDTHGNGSRSDIFLWAAGGTVALSILLDLFGKKEKGSSLRKWLPAIVTLGSYARVRQSQNGR